MNLSSPAEIQGIRSLGSGGGRRLLVLFIQGKLLLPTCTQIVEFLATAGQNFSAPAAAGASSPFLPSESPPKRLSMKPALGLFPAAAALLPELGLLAPPPEAFLSS